VAVHEHTRLSKSNLKVGVITASDSRTPETDSSGRLIRERLETAGHAVVYYEIVPDVAERIAGAVLDHLEQLDAVIVNGGTGIAPRDSTIEALRPLLEKEIEGFGEIFRALSYQEIGASAMLSRALAGVCKGRFIAALPGSTAGCRLAMEKLIVPELGHIAYLLGQ
jgi:molybdenum cofactor biosynthesis protein B